jgi:hypothetical protein
MSAMPCLPHFRLRREPASREAEQVPAFAWAPEGVGERHQLGGEPTWLEGDATPTCRECGERMTFYGQLDSISDDLVLADAGLVYVFVCFNDFEAQALVQSS